MTIDIKDLRIKKGVSQVQCAEATNIPLRTLKRYEQGYPIGDVQYFCRLIMYFDVTLEEFIGVENAMSIFED